MPAATAAEFVAVDLGGTHARFALARIDDGRIAVDEPSILRTADHANFEAAWHAFAGHLGRPLPRAAAMAVAGPVQTQPIKLTNCPWTIAPAAIAQELELDRFVLVNDFAAVGHAVARLEERYFSHVAGPQIALPSEGLISVIGPGTGLGVAAVLRHAGGYTVVSTEGGHSDFAPLDCFEDELLARLRQRYRHVSAERVVSGPGLAHIHEGLALAQNRATGTADDSQLWSEAISGKDELAAAALERFCMALGAVAGNIALAQGANCVVLAGGLSLRLADRLPNSGFSARFTAKGRFVAMMSAIPVKAINHPQPGLFGAAAAFQIHRSDTKSDTSPLNQAIICGRAP